MAGLRIDVVTLFPKMFKGPFSESMLKRAQDKGLLEIRLVNPRDHAEDVHRTVDDRSYGGGPGMVLKPEPLYRALRACGVRRKAAKAVSPRVIFLSPQGKLFKQDDAKRLAEHRHLVLLCGHYEGVDERIMDWVHEEISFGDFVLTGGEIPAMAVVDAVARLKPGVVKERGSVEADSFFRGLLDHPHYTRPARWRKRSVPGVLLTGDHKAINAWRREQSVGATKTKRPELMETV